MEWFIVIEPPAAHRRMTWGQALEPRSCKAELVAFVTECHFYLTLQLTDTYWKSMVKFRYLADIISKVNEQSLSQEKTSDDNRCQW